MTEWKEYKLGEIVTFQRGHDLPKDKMIDGDIPVAGSNGIIGYHNQFTKEGPGVTIGRSGNIGIPHYYPNAYWAHNTVLYIVDFKGNDAKFMYYLLKTFDFTQLNTGSAVPSLNRNHIHELPVSIPDVSTQRRIASILSSLDDKIDLLHRENATLEQMAETLFRQWFVVEAKEEWEEGTIVDLVEFNPTRKLVKGTVAPFLEMSNLSTSTYSPTYWYDRAYDSGSKFENGDTLLARITPCLENGKTAYVDFLCDNQVGWGSTEFIVMHSKLRLHPFFTYVIAKYQDFRDFAESCMSGSSGRQRVDVDNLKQYSMAVPDQSTVELFNNRIENIVSKMHNNNNQIRTLIETRDGLLPRLMGGEVKL